MTALLNVKSDEFFRIIRVTTPEENVELEENEEVEVSPNVKGPIPMPLEVQVTSENPRGFWSDFTLM